MSTNDGCRADKRKARAEKDALTVEAVALRVLTEHEYMNGLKRGSICACGFVPLVDADSLNSQQDYHRAHVAARLAAAIEARP